MASGTRPSDVQTGTPEITTLPKAQLPTLESGDHLTRAEFERRYSLRPDIKKAELIEGVVYVMSSAVRYRRHGSPHYHLVTWLGTYTAATPGLEGADDTSVRLDEDNEPQPDILLRIPSERGGKSRVSEDDYLEAAPDFVVEIAASSASYDLHSKKDVYRRSGVREYLVFLTEQPEVRWFALREGRYVQLEADPGGTIRSQIFPGLWLNNTALLAGDLAGVLQLLQQGIASPEHAAFVERLRQAGA